jgi:flagellar motility protein MotE (MotC chaperone)
MKGKLKIPLLCVLAAGSFAVSYLLTGRLGPPPAAPADANDAGGAAADLFNVPGARQVTRVTASMKERELDALIKEVRLKIDTYKRKEAELTKRESRVAMAAAALDKQAEDLERLRLKLVAPLARLREAKAALEQTRLRIGRQEQANLKRTAKIYDKMDAARASEILTNMCTDAQEQEAVKILRYMTDRAAAKLLGEMADRSLAARLCQHLKRVQEDEG